MFNFLKVLKAEPELLFSISISIESPSKRIKVSSFDKDSFKLQEISEIHLLITFLSGRRAPQDNKFNFIITLILYQCMKNL